MMRPLLTQRLLALALSTLGTPLLNKQTLSISITERRAAPPSMSPLIGSSRISQCACVSGTARVESFAWPMRGYIRKGRLCGCLGPLATPSPHPFEREEIRKGIGMYVVQTLDTEANQKQVVILECSRAGPIWQLITPATTPRDTAGPGPHFDC